MKRKALFPGSFDPFTAGHLNILKRALTMFDEVVIAIGINIDKKGHFSTERKMEIIRQATAGLEGVEITKYDNLTVDICYYNREKTLQPYGGKFGAMIRSDLRFEWLKKALDNKKKGK